MSTRRGAAKKQGPKHQNTFAFKHNKNSKKTKVILGINHFGLCTRCHEIIEWKKKYRKYKPLKAPKKWCVSRPISTAVCHVADTAAVANSNGCDRRSITKAYHTLCDGCARTRGVCAKCGKEPADEKAEAGEAETEEELIERLEAGVPGMRERDRRAMLRKLYRGEGAESGEDGEEGGDADGEGESPPDVAAAGVDGTAEEAGAEPDGAAEGVTAFGGAGGSGM